MGLFDFARDIGAKLFNTDAEAARRIKEHLDISLTDARGIEVAFDDGVVTLTGECDSQRTRELAILLAGNVKGVERVEAGGLAVRAPIAAAAPAPGPAASTPATPAAAAPEQRVEYYDIKSGDTLSAIAKRYYGKASAYMRIFEANRELIKDPDKIYPGQKIRIPLDD
jgi:nucleoid-associated protein YgaU